MPALTTAAIVEAAGTPFALTEVELDDPRPNELRVRMVAVGVCHTDLSVAAGGLPFPLPGVLGHEGAGVVEAVGSAVTRAAVGDRVLLSFTSCGGCGSCRDGHPAYCDTWLPDNLVGGARRDGSSPIRRDGVAVGGHFFGQSSFARHAIVDERSVVRVDERVPLDVLAPLGCGVLTGVGAVWHALAPRPGATMLITGAGAVGLSAVMAAGLSSAGRIIVADRLPERLKLALEFGAHEVIDVTQTDLASAVTGLTSLGLDGVIETTGSTEVLGTAIGALAPRGTAVIVGAPPFGATVPVDVTFMLAGRRIVGVTLGDAETQALIPALVDLVAAGRLPIERLITHYEFEDIAAAVEDLHGGRSIKAVLRFGDA